MAYKINFSCEKNYLTITVDGFIDFNIFRQISEKAMASPQFRSGLNAVWDISESDFEDANVVELLQEIAIFEQTNLTPVSGPIKVAIVASADLQYGIARMLEAYGDSEGIKHKIFRKFEKAVKWIEG